MITLILCGLSFIIGVIVTWIYKDKIKAKEDAVGKDISEFGSKL